MRAGAEPQSDFPALPLPPPVEGLTGLPTLHPSGRRTQQRLVRHEAQQRGLPPEVADAVAQVESAYNPKPSEPLARSALCKCDQPQRPCWVTPARSPTYMSQARTSGMASDISPM